MDNMNIFTYVSHSGSFWPALLHNKSAYEIIVLSLYAYPCPPASALDILKGDYSAIGGRHDVMYLIS